MGRGATLALKITGDSSGGVRAIDDVEGKAGIFGGHLGKIAGIAAGAFAVDKVLDFGKAAFDSASNLEQMTGSVQAVFGKASEQMIQFAEKADKTVGLSTAGYEQMAAVIGSQLKNAGVPMDQLGGKTDALMRKGADMSAVFGGTAADAVDALSSVMKGEFDPIEKYGVSLNQTSINAELAARGQSKLTGAALKQAQVTAALDIVTKQTAATQGQFAKQSGTAAEKSQVLSAWFDNLKASVGSYLLPIFTALADFFMNKLAPAFDKLTADTGPLGNILGTVADFVTEQLLPAITSLWKEIGPKLGPILSSVGKIVTGTIIPAFKGAFNIIKQYVIPIFKTVLTPVLHGISTVFHKVSDALEKNKGKFAALFEKIKPFLDFLRDKVAPFIGKVLGGAFNLLGKAIGPIVDLITWVLEKAGAVLGFIGKVGSFIFGGSDSKTGVKTRGASRVFGATAGGGSRLFGASSSLGGGSVGPATAAQGLSTGPTVNITVQGMILDPTALAAQLQSLLDRYATRTGARVALAVT